MRRKDKSIVYAKVTIKIQYIIKKEEKEYNIYINININVVLVL
jgi:hypothetical protein